jgi:4-aminobutyrate aminotransferase
VRPDVVVVAKAIASGLPLSGILAARELLDAFPPGSHGGTYGGNAVACAAALATLDVIEEEGLVEAAAERGERLLKGIRSVAGDHPRIAEVRGRGLMVALEFADPETLAARGDLAKSLLAGALERHVLLLTCGPWSQVVRIVPPLVTTEDEIDLAVRVIGEVLDAIDA